MIYRFVMVALASLLLAACGRGSEDFAFKVARPADKVEAAFDHLSVGGNEMAALVPGLKVDRSKPEAGQLIYTVPGDGDFPATIKLTFESVEGGKATVLHVAVDAPRTEVQWEGKTMVVSESKVEGMVGKALRKAVDKLENGESIESERTELGEVLTILAIITDSKKLAQIKDMANYPEWYASGLGWLFDGGEGGGGAYGDPAIGEDPNSGARREERRQEEAAAAAAGPMDDAQGDSARGEDAGPSEE